MSVRQFVNIFLSSDRLAYIRQSFKTWHDDTRHWSRQALIFLDFRNLTKKSYQWLKTMNYDYLFIRHLRREMTV